MRHTKPNIDEIIEGEGLGDLKFGMFKDDVILILGQPNEIEEYSYTSSDHDLTESWHYDELDLSLGFDEEDDWRLVTIAIGSSNCKFRDFYPIGLSKDELTKKLHELYINDLEFEDWSSEESPSHELLTSDLLGINFWFDDNRLSEVQWGPHFIDDENIKWPKIEKY